jgi:acyl-CoA reductase-like NAD-dependent aldehyde dehydrogenase
MLNYQIYQAGTFITTSSILEISNPFTGKVFAQTFLAGKKELEKAIEKAEAVTDELKNLSSYKRYEILMEISSKIKDKREQLGHILCLESGKPIRYALAEIDRAAQTFLVAAEESKRLPKEYISLDWTIAGEGKEGLIKYFPIGLIAGISPFNFPLNLAVHKIAPAIASGCPIILKPASSTPLSTLELAKIIDKTSLPKGAVSILPMDRKTGNQLVTDERFKLLSFTGSPAVGWEMKRSAGKKKTVLELGGNAAVIITQSADLKKAMDKCVTAGFAYSGQICIHAQRFYVHKEIFEKFISAFISSAKKLKQGDPTDKTTEISNMIDEENAKRVENWINESVNQGAQIVLGGKRNGSYVEPTVLTNTASSMKVCAEEIFGPVVTIEKFDTLEEAVHLVNDSKFGLQAGIFTNNAAEIEYSFNTIEAGGIIVNDVPTLRLDHMPYGGTKDSGQGREGVKYAILDMIEARILVR